MNEQEKGFCTDCAQNMEGQWPTLAKLLRVCPDCSAKRVVKVVYKMFGRNKPPFASRKS